MIIESNIGFIPAGEMNIALALAARRNNHQVTVWFHGEDSLGHFEKTHESPNPRLKRIKLRGINGTNNLVEAVEGKDFVFITPKSQHLRETVRNAAPFIRRDATIVCATKGFDEYNGKYYTPSEVIEQELKGNIPDIKDRVAVLSGPNFARQIALDKLTGTTVAAYQSETAEMVRDVLDSKSFWVDPYQGKPIDVEIMGAYKNVIGLAVGFARTMKGYSSNTGAFILQKGLKEAAVLCEAMGGSSAAITELCGFGDFALLMGLTSRNVRAGYNLGKGRWTIEDLMDPKRTIEGVRSAAIIRALSQDRDHRVLMPITRTVYLVLYHGLDPQVAIKTLLTTKEPKVRKIATNARKENGNGHRSEIELSAILA